MRRLSIILLMLWSAPALGQIAPTGDEAANPSPKTSSSPDSEAAPRAAIESAVRAAWDAAAQRALIFGARDQASEAAETSAQLVVGSASTVSASERPTVPPAPFQDALTLPNPFEPSGEPLDDERTPPDYDRRPPPPPTALEIVAWVPRIIFFPVYLVSEYLIRAPLEVLVEWYERDRVLQHLSDATSSDDNLRRILPRLRIESGVQPAIGLTFIWQEMFIEDNDWAVGADTDFNDNLTVDVISLYHFDDDARLGLRYRLEQRDDFVFFGTGADTDGDDETRFLRNKMMGILEAELDTRDNGLGGLASFEFSDNDFRCSTESSADICGPDGQPNTADDRLQINEPDSADYFSNGYQLLRLKLHGFWDSRDPILVDYGNGVRVDLFGRYGKGVGDAEQIHFFRYGGETSFFWNIWRDRILGLRLYSEITETIGDSTNADIPFAELITLGGVERMRGFLHGRFHGSSALVATIDYRYPVSSFFFGNIFFEAGNAFGNTFNDFEFGLLRPSVGLSLRSTASRYQTYGLTIALGGAPFEQGGGIEFVRLSLGTNLGF